MIIIHNNLEACNGPGCMLPWLTDRQGNVIMAQLYLKGSIVPCDLVIHNVTRQKLQCVLCHLWAICLGFNPMMFACMMLETVLPADVPSKKAPSSCRHSLTQGNLFSSLTTSGRAQAYLGPADPAGACIYEEASPRIANLQQQHDFYSISTFKKWEMHMNPVPRLAASGKLQQAHELRLILFQNQTKQYTGRVWLLTSLHSW